MDCILYDNGLRHERVLSLVAYDAKKIPKIIYMDVTSVFSSTWISN